MFIVTPGLLWNQVIGSEVSGGVERGRECEFMTEAEFGTMASELFKGFILVCLSLLKTPLVSSYCSELSSTNLY